MTTTMKYGKFKKIVNNIKKNFPDIEFSHHINDDNVRIITTGNALISVLPESSWSEVKRNMEKVQLQKWRHDDCRVCDNPIVRNVRCSSCSENTCSDCYINNFKTNRGLIVCPFCQFTYGRKMSASQINRGVLDIQQKLGLY
jgi:hypothetical protein